ncbi:MAG: hypothetical protein KDE03_17285 [Rhodobacteraceae bacterium]|nr:hypothetical protein [Paracoccaceae bacterium]
MKISQDRTRLCETILGGDLESPQLVPTIVEIPMTYEDINDYALLAAREAIYSYTPEHVRQMLPFVLDCLARQRSDLFETGFFRSYFSHINRDFHLSKALGNGALKYSGEYRRGWVAPAISAMSAHERRWVMGWVQEIANSDLPEVKALFESELSMFLRILAMGLDIDEAEAPPIVE